MSPLALWLYAVLIIGSGIAADVPFVFDEAVSSVAGYTSAQLEQAQISSPYLVGVPTVTLVADNDVLNFPITGGGNIPVGTIEKNVSDLKKALDAAVEPDNPRVREEALVLALKYPGEKTIDQVCSIYSYLKNGDESKKGWGYVSDPRGLDYFNYANASLKAGDRAKCVGGGDCDDFAILMAALVESVGGTTRIILARNNTTGGHAYTEVHLGQLNIQKSQVEAIIDWLKEKFDTDKIYTHIDTDTKDVWLNLDWGADERGNFHPGGPLYQGDKHIVVCIRDAYDKTPLKLSEPSQETAQINQSCSEKQTVTLSCAMVQKWERTFGGAGTDNANSVRQTSDGGYIITGYTDSYGSGSTDAWLIKTDSTGKEKWNRTFGRSGYNYGYSVLQANDGGYIITGSIGALLSSNVWLIKTDVSGNKLWDKTFGGSKSDGGSGGRSVQQTSDGGYIIAGNTYSYGAGGSDAWLIKTDLNGNKLWDRTFGGSNSDAANSVQQTSDGGYIIAGNTYSYGAGGSDAWLIKTDLNGNKLWDRTFGGSNSGAANSVQQTSDGGYIIVGANNNNAWLIKTDSSGKNEWDKTFGGPGNDDANSVLQANDGSYIIIGSTRSFGAGEDDIWLIKTDAFGNSLWDKTFGGSNYDQGGSIQPTNDGGYIIVGGTIPVGAEDFDSCLIKTDANGESRLK